MSKDIRDSERSSTALARVVAVYGASGHTGRFVVSELQRRGWKIIAVGRDSKKLQALGEARPDLVIRVASIDDPKLLDEAFAGAVAVINCAGPFLDTAAPLISAALRARIHYFDVTAEQAATLAAFEQFSAAARDAGVLVLPSMAFYGGLADLLATATMDDWNQADEFVLRWDWIVGNQPEGHGGQVKGTRIAGLYFPMASWGSSLILRPRRGGISRRLSVRKKSWSSPWRKQSSSRNTLGCRRFGRT